MRLACFSWVVGVGRGRCGPPVLSDYLSSVVLPTPTFQNNTRRHTPTYGSKIFLAQGLATEREDTKISKNEGSATKQNQQL